MSDKNPFAAEAPKVENKADAKAKTTKKGTNDNKPVSPFGDKPVKNSTSPVFADYGSPANKGPKKSYKKLITGISVGVGVAVVIAVAVTVFIAMTTVSRDDYRTAYERLNDIQRESSRSSSLSYSSINSDSTVNDVDKIRDKTKESLDKIDNELNDFSKLKAVKNDKEVKLRYDKADKALDDVKSSLNSSMNAVKDILPLIQDMNSVSDVDYDSSDSDAYYKKLVDNYKALAETAKKTKTSDNDLKDSLADLADASTAIANYYQDEVDDKNPSYSTYSKARSKFSNASQDISSSLYDLTRDLTTKAQAFDDAASNLQRYLSDRYYNNGRK